MNKLQKLSLSIKANQIDGPLSFDVISTYQLQPEQENNCYEFNTWHDVTKTSSVTVRLLENFGKKTHLQIEKIKLNEISLDNLDLWSRYVTFDRGVIPGTFGYMSVPGEYRMKIHQNALVHNYMAYFLSRCKQ